MSTSHELRRVTKERIESLSPQQLKVAAEFLKYLAERASEEATAELLKTTGLVKDLQRAPQVGGLRIARAVQGQGLIIQPVTDVSLPTLGA